MGQRVDSVATVSICSGQIRKIGVFIVRVYSYKSVLVCAIIQRSARIIVRVAQTSGKTGQCRRVAATTGTVV